MSWKSIVLHLLIPRQTFLGLIKAWPADIYTSADIQEAVRNELQGNENDEILLESLAELYVSFLRASLPTDERSGTSTMANPPRRCRISCD